MIGVNISERKSGTERTKKRKKRESVMFSPPAQLVLQHIVYGSLPMFPGRPTYVPRCLCSRYLCSPVPMFPGAYVPGTHGRRSVGDGGDASPPLFSLVGTT